MKAHARAAVLILTGLIFLINTSVVAEDVHIQAAGPIGLGYIGMYYGLVNPADGNWYEAQVDDFMGGFDTSTTWLAVVDTGASASILGKSTQIAYDAGTPIPLQLYPDVKFTDIGFGGTVDFAVTEPVQVMIAGQKAATGDTENHALFNAYTPAITMAAARDFIGGGEIDMDIIGTSILQGQVLQVDPHELEFLRWMLFTMAGSLDNTPPAAGGQVLYVPMTMQGFFTEPPAADVGENPMLPIKIRRTAGDAFAERSALFDTGSPVNFVSESFALDAGIDTSAPADLTIPVIGVGGEETTRDGYYVDALSLELGAGREGDQLVFANTAVFVIPDANMPGGLEAILGNGILSPSTELVDTTVTEWYVDMRDGDNPYLIVVVPEPASASLLLFGALAILIRRRK
ncbi:MAG: aspartyl protease family protein [Planctomycetota bacterium]|nr:aspartyl protease family protein [Planctomycetota bacterium]